MSLMDSVKKIAGETLAKNAQDFISNNAGQLAGPFIKEQLKSGNLQQIQNIVTEIIGEQGSVGGIKALVNKFNAAGLGSLIQSWIDSGKNMSFTMQQVNSVFGEDWIQTLANKVGLSATMLTGLIAYFLPSVVDTATKDGQIPEKSSSETIDITELLTSLIK